MSSVTISYPSFVWKRIKRIGPLGTVLLLHLTFFWALKSGLVDQARQVMPREIFASFITPATAPEAALPLPLPLPIAQPAAPKTVAIVKRSITQPRPAPLSNNIAAEAAISVPTPAGQPYADAPAVPAQNPVPETAPALAPAPAPATLTQPVTAPASLRTISSGVEYIQPPVVRYPAAAKRMGEAGKSIIRVLINEKGRAERVELQKSSGSARLDETAKEAVMRALFKPYTEDGKALPVFAIVPINFQLSN